MIPTVSAKRCNLADIHLEKGMHCNDCHFAQDNHGNGKITVNHGRRSRIDCIDCHGTIRKKATLITSGPAAPEGGRHLDALRTPWGLRRFESRDGKIVQRSMRMKTRMGDRSDYRQHHAGQCAFQRKIFSRETDNEGWQRVFANAGRRKFTRPRQ